MNRVSSSRVWKRSGAAAAGGVGVDMLSPKKGGPRSHARRGNERFVGLRHQFGKQVARRGRRRLVGDLAQDFFEAVGRLAQMVPRLPDALLVAPRQYATGLLPAAAPVVTARIVGDARQPVARRSS